MSVRSVNTLAAALALLVLAPTPAFARDRLEGSAEMQRALADPRTQDAVGNALGALMGAMLNVKAEPFAKAMESMGDRESARRIPRGATLGDLAGPDARKMPREIRRRVPGMMTAMGSMVGVLDEMMPQLEAIGKDFEAQMDAADRLD